MSGVLTCITCSVQFKEAGGQRDHYKTDWHRYNLKRKVAEMPPIQEQEFKVRFILNSTIFIQKCTYVKVSRIYSYKFLAGHELRKFSKSYFKIFAKVLNQ